jgi:hypothetical protein
MMRRKGKARGECEGYGRAPGTGSIPWLVESQNHSKSPPAPTSTYSPAHKEHLKMIIQHENKTHQTTANNAETTRQTAVAAAIAAGGGDAAVALAIKNAEAAFYRAVIASCVANNLPANSFREGLYSLTGKWT